MTAATIFMEPIDEMKDVWSPIPGFTDYEINRCGEVYSLKSEVMMNTDYKPGRGRVVHLYDGGRSFTRGVRNLVELAFPEYVSVFAKGGSGLKLDPDKWITIPGFPNYIVNQMGQIKNTYRGKSVQPRANGMFQLRKNGKKHAWYFKDLEAEGKTWDELWGGN